MDGKIYVYPRASTNQFIEVVAERLEGAPIGERRRWSDEFKERGAGAFQWISRRRSFLRRDRPERREEGIASCGNLGRTDLRPLAVAR